MAATSDSGLGHGSSGMPQTSIEETEYSDKVTQNENKSQKSSPPIYAPSPKHKTGHNWGSEDPIKSQSEGQMLLDTGYKNGKQVYNITDEGIIVKFQPEGNPNNEYHAYKVSKPRDIPNSILKQLLNDGKITQAEYNKFRKGKK